MGEGDDVPRTVKAAQQKRSPDITKAWSVFDISDTIRSERIARTEVREAHRLAKERTSHQYSDPDYQEASRGR